MRPIWIIAIIAVLLICLCVGAACLGLGAFSYIYNNRTETTSVPFPVQEKTRQPAQLTPFPNQLPTMPLHQTPQANVPNLPNTTPVPADNAAFETLSTLEQAIVPNNDPRDLAQRLGGKGQIPETVPAPPAYQVGDQQQFWASNVDTNESFRVDSTLQYATPHVYFWVENGVKFNQRDLKELVDTFENKIYPTDREFFGSEWTPGIDNDPHLNILFARNLGNSIAGYFSSADEVPPEAHEYSNAREMFMMNADNVDLGADFTYGVLAHEFQHMIHWYRDRNEESWMNEGFSELAAFLNGYDPGGFDYSYISNPDLQLNDWPNNPDATTPHYGAAFLFLDYFLNRFGEDATKAVVSNPDNGLDSIDEVLTQMDAKDPQTGNPIKADDLFADWVITNYVQNSRIGDGRYYYENYQAAPQASETEDITRCDNYQDTQTVNQYGVDYIRITCGNSVTLNFQGNTEVGVIPENAHSGNYAFWSNKGDESDITLTQTFDFSQVSGPIDMSYWTWYDLEKDYDYLFLVASADDGKTWQIIKTPSCTTEDPSGNSYGCGYNGTTGNWIQENVDLSQFAGQKVTLRFEYITDAAVNGEGFLLDDISIPAIQYSTDFEQNDGGWQSDGFVRIENRLPQTFRVSLIKRNGKQTSIEYLTLNDTQALSIPLDFDQGLDDAVLVVSGTTRFTRQQATYSIQLAP